MKPGSTVATWPWKSIAPSVRYFRQTHLSGVGTWGGWGSSRSELSATWRTKLTQFFSEKCNVLFQDTNSPQHTFLSPEGMEELKRIQHDMVITYADKSAHDFVLCCKNVYKRLLWEEIHSPHYEETEKNRFRNLERACSFE